MSTHPAIAFEFAVTAPPGGLSSGKLVQALGQAHFASHRPATASRSLDAAGRAPGFSPAAAGPARRCAGLIIRCRADNRGRLSSRRMCTAQLAPVGNSSRGRCRPLGDSKRC